MVFSEKRQLATSYNLPQTTTLHKTYEATTCRSYFRHINSDLVEGFLSLNKNLDLVCGFDFFSLFNDYIHGSLVPDFSFLTFCDEWRVTRNYAEEELQYKKLSPFAFCGNLSPVASYLYFLETFVLETTYQRELLFSTSNQFSFYILKRWLLTFALSMHVFLIHRNLKGFILRFWWLLVGRFGSVVTSFHQKNSQMIGFVSTLTVSKSYLLTLQLN